MRKAKKPNTMQKLFCHELLTDPKNNYTQAAIRSGFSAKTAYSIGSRMMNHKDFSHVKAYFDSLVKKKTNKLDIKADKILKNLDEVSDVCLGRKKVLDKEGNEVGTSEFNASGAIGANKLLGQYLKMWTDDEGRDVEVNVTVMPAIMVDGKPFKPKIGKDING